MTHEELSQQLAAIASPQRILILSELANGRAYISDLARKLAMSRALLYLHLAKLEEQGSVTTSLELSEDGKALKYVTLADFSLHIDITTVTDAVHTSKKGK